MKKIHPKYVPGYYGTPEQLAEKLGELRYDINLKVDRRLVEVYKQQAQDDERAGHPQLAKLLRQRVEIMQRAADNMEKIFKLCKDKPGMKDETRGF